MQGTYTRLKVLVNDLENKGVSISQAEDSDSDVEEDTKSSNKFLDDLNAEFHDKALLINQRRLYKRSGRIDAMPKGKSKKGLVAESFDWDEEFVSYEDEGVTKVKEFMSISKDGPSVGKGGAMLDYTYVDLYCVEDHRKNLLSKFNSLNQEFSSYKDEITDLKKVIEKWASSKVTLDQLLFEQIPSNIVHAVGGRGKKKDTISSKEDVFSKASESPFVNISNVNSNFESESESDNLEPLPSLPKLIGAKPTNTSADVVSRVFM
ncbi:hypothetical protein Tco_0815497 [Tanacetum coccineum]